MEIKLLEWDTAFFKRPVVKVSIDAVEQVEMEQVLENCKSKGYKFLYFFVDAINTAMVAELTHRLGEPINEKLIFVITDLDPGKINAHLDAALTVVNAGQLKTDPLFREQLLQLTIKAGAFSRFKIDAALDDSYFKELYTTWTTAMLNDSDYRIIVAKHKDEKTAGITGFLSYKIINEGYRIEFMSINEAYQKKGIGKALLKKMMEEVYGNGPGYVTTEIHRANDSAYHFFLSNRFSLTEAVNIYHVHL